MIACVDVDYRSTEVVAACVVLDAWTDAAGRIEKVHRSTGAAAEYEPGQFYRRELPYLTAVIGEIGASPDVVIVDGHVWLVDDAPGLGAHLHAALGGGVAIVGVAKRPFFGANRAIPVLRGASKHPLYVSAIGIDDAIAAAHVRSMHGPHRIPTLLKRVDRLCRDA